MEDAKSLIQETERKMKASLETLDHDHNSLRTGRASTSLFDAISVESPYGGRFPINQLATVSVIDTRMLSIQVWDNANAKPIEKAITGSNLGLNPIAEGQNIRVPVPPLSEDRRKTLAKVAGEHGEKARIAVRNIRRDAIDQLKKMEKNNLINEDELHSFTDDIQKITENYNKKIDEQVAKKEKDILSV